ncbi:outer membrane lipoprotein LolB [Roseateles asaccharophilus]|uniref:Outer-membrane lipoprotein LolB n=1 Tax=Roseateles asaccharophilus TaxID=582607 RepID=A0ABU2A8Z5_9BURK|nr:outer membrane lipoprotein LolB [Roseateles asaccharophilus]MDR7333671.1 outer membrane lipoprotein LolB [Roseateles asaccharophilus]
MRAAVFAAALALAGCAQLPREAAPTPTGEARLGGRISVTVAGDAHKRGTGGAASFELFGGPHAGRLELTSPLGSLVARASWKPGLVTLKTPDDERRFDDLDALTRELLGEAVPVAALFDWLQARPWPAAPHQKTATGFEQLGWRIEPKLPALVATRLADPVVTLRAKLDGGDESTP